MSSENAFNLNKSNILSFGKEFICFLLLVLRTNFFSSHCLTSNITIFKTGVGGENGMNSPTMTIIYPRAEIVQAQDLTSDLLHLLLLTKPLLINSLPNNQTLD